MNGRTWLWPTLRLYPRMWTQDQKLPWKNVQLVTVYTPLRMKNSNSATGTHSRSHLYLILQDSFQSYFPTYKKVTHFLASQAELYMYFTFSIQSIRPTNLTLVSGLDTYWGILSVPGKYKVDGRWMNKNRVHWWNDNGKRKAKSSQESPSQWYSVTTNPT
jgi:hypothetical protein